MEKHKIVMLDQIMTADDLASALEKLQPAFNK
jgi:hypothetical protein